MQKKRVFLYILSALAVALAILFIYSYRAKLGRIVMPFVLAVPVTYIVKPLALKLQNRKIPCNISILLIYIFFILAFAAACLFFFPELAKNARELMETLPDIVKRYEQLLGGILSFIRSSDWSEDVKEMIFREIQNGMAMAQDYSANILKKAMNIVFDTVGLFINLTVAMVVAYYFIKDSAHFRLLALSFLPRRWRSGMTALGIEINGILAGFIQGQLLAALIVGVLETLGLMLVGVRYPLVLGMLGGVANIIPYFGPYIGVIPAMAVALIQSPLKMFWVFLVFMAVQQVDNSFISPKIIEGRLGLHPVATILAVLAGGEFFGVAGMLLAVPVMAILRAVVRRIADGLSTTPLR